MSTIIRILVFAHIVAVLISCSEDSPHDSSSESGGTDTTTEGADTVLVVDAASDSDSLSDEGSPDTVNTGSSEASELNDVADDSGGEAVSEEVGAGVPATVSEESEGESELDHATVDVDTEDNQAYFGVIAVSDTLVSAEFYRYLSSHSEADSTDFSVQTAHVCSDSNEALLAAVDVESNAAFEPVSAGETITFTGPQGTFVELHHHPDDGLNTYSAGVNVSSIGSIPVQVVVDIPGDEFPALSNVVVPDTNLNDSTVNQESANSSSSASSSSSAVSNDVTNPGGQLSQDTDTSTSSQQSESATESADASYGHMRFSACPSEGDQSLSDRDDSYLSEPIEVDGPLGKVVVVIVRAAAQGRAMVLAYRIQSRQGV